MQLKKPTILVVVLVLLVIGAGLTLWLSGEQLPVELPEGTLIDVPLAAYIPADYVPDSALRLRLYRRMAVADSLAEIDDLAAELDQTHRKRLIELLLASGAQVFITSTDAGLLDTTAWKSCKMFHVEHGCVKEMV